MLNPCPHCGALLYAGRCLSPGCGDSLLDVFADDLLPGDTIVSGYVINGRDVPALVLDAFYSRDTGFAHVALSREGESEVHREQFNIGRLLSVVRERTPALDLPPCGP